MSGNFLKKKKRDELKELGALLPGPFHPLLGVMAAESSQLSPNSWTRPRPNRVEAPKVKPLSWEQPKSKDLSMQISQRSKTFPPTGDDSEGSFRHQNCPGVDWGSVSSTAYPALFPSFSHWCWSQEHFPWTLCTRISFPESASWCQKLWRVWDFYPTCKITSSPATGS